MKTEKKKIIEKFLDCFDLKQNPDLDRNFEFFQSFCEFEKMSLIMKKNVQIELYSESSGKILKLRKKSWSNIDQTTKTITILFPNIHQLKIIYASLERRCFARNLFIISILKHYSPKIETLTFKGNGSFQVFDHNEDLYRSNAINYEEFFDFSLKKFNFSMPNLKRLFFEGKGRVEYSHNFFPNLVFLSSGKKFHLKFGSDEMISVDELIMNYDIASLTTRFNVQYLTLNIYNEFFDEDMKKVKFHFFLINSVFFTKNNKRIFNMTT